MRVFKSFGDIEVRTEDFQPDNAPSIYLCGSVWICLVVLRDEKEWQFLPCMFLGMCPCSPYDRESPRDSVSTLGSMSALPAWAGDSAPLGGTPGPERQTFPQTRLKVSQMSFLALYFLLSVSLYLPIIGPCSEYEAWFKRFRLCPNGRVALPVRVCSDLTSLI